MESMVPAAEQTGMGVGAVRGPARPFLVLWVGCRRLPWGRGWCLSWEEILLSLFSLLIF